MEEEYIKEKKIKEKNKREKEKDILALIIKTKDEMEKINKNFELADEEMIDYYAYQLKANESKLDYLIKFAKNMGISQQMIEAIELKLSMQNDEAI